MSEKLIKIAAFNTDLNALLGTNFQAFSIYRSKGLLAHLLNRKHFVAAKYMGIIGVIFAPAIAATTVVLIEEVYMKSLDA